MMVRANAECYFNFLICVEMTFEVNLGKIWPRGWRTIPPGSTPPPAAASTARAHKGNPDSLCLETSLHVENTKNCFKKDVMLEIHHEININEKQQ